MKTNKKRIRAVRALAVAGCAVGLAGPSAAMAMPQDWGSLQQPATSSHPYPASHAQGYASETIPTKPFVPDTSGAKLDHRGTSATRDFAPSLPSRFSLPAQFRTDTQSGAVRPSPSSAPDVVRYSQPANTDAQSGAPKQSPSSAPASVVREIRTVVHDNGRTLAIVLAGTALGIALCGSGYAALRLTRLQRRVLSS